MVGRAAERPPLERLRQQPLVRGFAALGLGAALEAGVSLSFRSPGLDDVGLATALGILIAVLAGAVAGAWFGLVVAAMGWTLHFFFVAEESLFALAALPAWLGAAAAGRALTPLLPS